ncbi:MAG: hypothetical protein K2H43_02665 [Clostridia bacterium]|nr:hypothetical protein [Clostridia bacterium]
MEQKHETAPEEKILPEEASFEATVPVKQAHARRKKSVKIDPLTGQVKRGFWAEEWHRLKKHRSIIWFVLPAFFLAFLFGYVPMIGLLIAFRDTFPIGGGRDVLTVIMRAWVRGNWSLTNFSKLIESEILVALKNTLVLKFFGLMISFQLPIIFALFLADIKNSAVSKLMLIVLCLPNFLSWSMTVGIWSNILEPKNGLVNNFLMSIGVLDHGFYFLGTSEWFKPLVIFLKVWKGTGWNAIIYYAAIASIDKSFFEAATLDGASKLQKIIWITLPTIVPVIGLSLIMTLTYIMSVGLEQVMAMYTPETKKDQMVLDAYIYDISLGSGMADSAFPTLIGIVNGLIALFLMLGGNAISKKLLKTSLW